MAADIALFVVWLRSCHCCLVKWRRNNPEILCHPFDDGWLQRGQMHSCFPASHCFRHFSWNRCLQCKARTNSPSVMTSRQMAQLSSWSCGQSHVQCSRVRIRLQTLTRVMMTIILTTLVLVLGGGDLMLLLLMMMMRRRRRMMIHYYDYRGQASSSTPAPHDWTPPASCWP